MCEHKKNSIKEESNKPTSCCSWDKKNSKEKTLSSKQLKNNWNWRLENDISDEHIQVAIVSIEM